MNNGFIVLDRGMLDWEWYKDVNTKIVFLHMLFKANWQDGRFMGHEIKRGSFVSSYQNLSAEVGLSLRQTRTAIEHLISTGEVTSKGHSKFTVFTINNYCKYQDYDKQMTSKRQTDDKQTTNNRQTDDKQPTTIEQINNITKEQDNKVTSKEKSVTKVTPKKKVFFEDEKLNQTVYDFIDMRKKIKKPMTDHAVELMINKLIKLSTNAFGELDIEKAILILEQSIRGSWTDIYELKVSTGQRSQFAERWANV